MNSPSKDPARPNPELDYAPPWAREQFSLLGEHRAALPVEKRAQNQLISDDDVLRRRSLEPDVVPEPTPGILNFWPVMLRTGIACAIAAVIAGVVVMPFSAKQTADKRWQIRTPPSSTTSDSAGSPVVRFPVTVPALVDNKSSSATESLPQPQSTTRPQMSVPPPRVIPPTTTANQLASNGVAAAGPAVNQPPRAIVPTPASDASRSTPAAPVPAPQSSPSASPALANHVAVLDDDETIRLIKHGKDLLKSGDFAAARLLFERAAGAGSVDAALALGSTYDPLIIKQLGAIAVTPDINSARKWYQIAADRGSAEASLQLANLTRAR
jgi:hypothetical protein